MNAEKKPAKQRPVGPKRIKRAKDFGLVNVQPAAEACRIAGISFPIACAILEKESGGRNVYGHDKGGAMYGVKEVTEKNFKEFYRQVVVKGHTSNGVGPCQITWKGFFPDMEKRGLKAWVPKDNMIYGFGLVAQYIKEGRAKGLRGDKLWIYVGTRYNGAEAYGVDLARTVREWKERFRAL